MASAKDECETLMNAMFPFAEQMLGDHGEFFPYGGAMTSGGDIVSVAGYEGTERPPSLDVIRVIKRAFVKGAREARFRATALVYDVRIVRPESGEKSDAVACSLNHRDNYSVVVFVPYRLEDGQPIFGDVFSEEGEADIFTTHGPSGWRSWLPFGPRNRRRRD